MTWSHWRTVCRGRLGVAGMAPLAGYLGLVGCFSQDSGRNERMNALNYFKDTKTIALANAVEKDDAIRIRKLAADGADINAKGEQGMTLLTWAIGNQKKNALRTLLELKANPNARDTEGAPVLEVAAQSEDLDYARMLLSSGADADTNARNGEPLIFHAIRKENWPLFRLLVERGANINGRGKAEMTPLIQLARLSEYDQVFWLLERGADFHLFDASGATLAWRVQQDIMDPQSEQTKWRQRVRQFLESQGVKFPVPTPTQILEQQKKD
jgi:uncharacterized protein